MESKSQLVVEICSISSTFSSCTHRRRSPRKPVFIDWYLVLNVDEDEGIDAVRKRYRQLALQLHPDKNKHPKADVAFKLVSEAYACLSDKAKRRAFNSERLKNFCMQCYKKSKSRPHASCTNVYKQKASNPKAQTKSDKMLSVLIDIQNRLKEECGVVENSLRANAAHRKESPLFDPSEQLLSSPGYPHYRMPVFENPKGLGNFHMTDTINHRRTGVRCESPIYEIGSENQTRRRRRSFGFWF
ncbi:uncharacterized protein [Typha angustifolia]|uniref:uncharacterized protein n=1 Tax=Typha angustifolia TaxID=59011 RepID=UPI003C2E41AC